MRKDKKIDLSKTSRLSLLVFRLLTNFINSYDSGGGIVIDIKIENVVASADTRTNLNLHQIALALENIEYDPAQFPGLIYHFKDPKGAVIFFSSGKIVCTGVTNIEAVHKVLNTVLQQLIDIGVSVIAAPEVQIQSIVASYDMHKLLNLNSIAITLGDKRVEYEPEQFSGLVYHGKDPSIAVLLYGSGKIVCTGAKSVEDTESAVKELMSDLDSTGLMA